MYRVFNLFPLTIFVFSLAHFRDEPRATSCSRFFRGQAGFFVASIHQALNLYLLFFFVLLLIYRGNSSR